MVKIEIYLYLNVYKNKYITYNMFLINSFTVGFIWQCFIFIPAWIYNSCNIYFANKPFNTIKNNQSSTQSIDDYFEYTKPDYYYDDVVINIHSHDDHKKSLFLSNQNLRCSNLKCSVKLQKYGELFVLGDGLWCKYSWNKEFLKVKRCFHSP